MSSKEYTYLQRREYRDDWIKRKRPPRFLYESQLLKLPNKPPQWPTRRIHWIHTRPAADFTKKRRGRASFSTRMAGSLSIGNRVTSWTAMGMTTEDEVVKFVADARVRNSLPGSTLWVSGAGSGRHSSKSRSILFFTLLFVVARIIF